MTPNEIAQAYCAGEFWSGYPCRTEGCPTCGGPDEGSKKDTVKHTPGPWHVGQGNGEGSVFSEAGRVRLELGGTTIYPICQVCLGWEESEDQANARLIAAAPDLLKALQSMLAFDRLIMEHRPGAVDAVGRARAAIARAGENTVMTGE